MADSETKQSALGYMFSKEGRPMLIGLVLILVVCAVILYYTLTTLLGGNDSNPSAPTASQRAAAGENQVSASSRQTGGDLTSQGLNPEARAALDEYNRQASENGRMGQPTPDDVVLIDVDENGLPTGNDSDSQQNEQKNLQNQRNQEPALPGNNSTAGRNGGGQSRVPRMGQPDPGVERTVGANGIDTQMAGLTPDQQRRRLNMTPERLELGYSEHEEFRSRRLQAAVEMINFESQPPSTESVAFGGNPRTSGDSPKPARIERRGGGNSADNQFVASDEGGGSASQCESPLVKGGEMRYAVSDIALNTDFQGPVRVTFLDGNLRDHIGMGSFELNELGAKMKLRIERIIDPDGVSYSVSGYGLDPRTTLWAQASDVNHHYIYRYGGFGLGSVLSAFQIIAENRATISEVNTAEGSTVTQNRDPDGKQITFTMLGEFGELLEESLRDNINRPITVTLDPNEEMAVLFEETVCEVENDANTDRKRRARRESNGFGDPLQSSRYGKF